MMIRKDIIKEGRIKVKGKIDKTHVTANYNISLDSSIDPYIRKESKSKCC